MLGTPAKILQNLSVSATCCSLEPGSVTAMKRLPTSFSSVIVNQPSQLLSSVLLHREASFCHSRATLLFFLQSSSEASTAAFNSFGSLWARRFTLTHAPRHASRRLRSIVERRPQRASRRP